MRFCRKVKAVSATDSWASKVVVETINVDDGYNSACGERVVVVANLRIKVGRNDLLRESDGRFVLNLM